MRLLSSFLAVLGFIASTVLPPAAALPSHAIQPLTYFPTNVSVHHSYHTHNDTGNYKYHAQNGTAVAKRQLGNIITCHGSKICQLGRDTRNSTAYKIFDQLTEQLKNGIDPGYTYTTEPGKGEYAHCIYANEAQKKLIPGLQGMIMNIAQMRGPTPCRMSGIEMRNRFQEVRDKGCKICGSSWSPQEESGCDFIIDHLDDLTICNKPLG